MRLNDRFTRTALRSLSSFVILGLSYAQGGSATWELNPATGVWNIATNWTPATVPNGPSDVATFSVSNITGISLLRSIEVNAIDFTAGASAFTISARPGVTLTISGTGVSNGSGIGQNFATSDSSDGAGAILFMGLATAGDGNTYTNNAHSNAINGVAATEFFGTSNAGTSTIINTNPGKSFHAGGFTGFFDQSSAANSTIINEVPPRGDVLDAFPSNTLFADNSTAGNAILIAQGSPHAFGDTWSEIDFYDQSTADHATITLEGGGPVSGGVAGIIFFAGTATAGNASITMQGAPPGGNGAAFGHFVDSSTAGNATIVLENGGGAGASLSFFSTTSGGEAAFTVNGNAVLDMQSHSVPGMAVGSLAGDGIVTIDALSLTVGTNNLDTEFAGTIQGSSDSTGTVIKTGTGTLILSGGNTYGAGTTIEAGTLLAATVDKRSATGHGPVQVNAGILGGGGVISGTVTVGSGNGAGAFLAPAAGTTQHKTLRLQSSLTFQSDATYTVTFIAKADRVRADKVVANGVTINSATIAIDGTAQGTLTTGTVITLISNTSANPINGTFHNLPDGVIVTVNGNNFEASYTGGDGNDLTLTVVP